MQVAIPQVERGEALKFAQVWKHNGISIILSDAHIDFATDFANVVLRSLVQAQIQMMEQQVAQENNKAIGGGSEIPTTNILTTD